MSLRAVPFVVVLGLAVLTAADTPRAQTPQRRPPSDAPARQGGDGQEERRAVPRPEATPQRNPPEAERRAVPRPDDDRARRDEAQRDRREPPRRTEPRRYLAQPRAYAFPPIDVRIGYYYHPYFGFYYGPYYGPFYPFPGPFVRPSRYSASALRTRVRPVETEVYVNGYYAGIVDDFDGVFQRLYLPAGEHQIDLRLTGYASFHQAVYVGPGDTFDLTHQMAPLGSGLPTAAPPAPRVLPRDWTEPVPGAPGDQPASPYGILALQIAPADARIVIDGEAWAPIEGQAEFVIHLPAGWHELEVGKEGYQRFSTRVELTEGQATRLSVQLTAP